MLNESKLIEVLKSKNIKFNYIGEKQVKNNLKTSNNYYNITSYKNNFEKYPSPAGRFEGKYIDLDKDLSDIDYELRILLFIMIMNIERFFKMRLLKETEIYDSDGYSTINEFLENDFKEEKRVHKSIFHKMGSVYHQEIFSRYDIDKDKKLENIPIWEFIEIITFGELVKFYEFFISKYNLRNEDIYILKDIVKLRNAVYHNTNILTNLKDKDNNHPQVYKVVKFLKESDINEKTRNNKLSNSRIRQITYTLYMFNEIVLDKKIKLKTKKQLKKFFYKRIKQHKEYYNNNDLLKSIYNYFDKIISNNYK